MSNGPLPGRWHNGGPVPAARHADLFNDVIPDYQSKPSYTYGRAKTKDYRYQFQQRIRSLQSVDQGVRRIIRSLRRTGELENTVVLFTSDNGFVLGEHRDHGKNMPWEEALRVPFLARGPIDSGKSGKAAVMTDVAPSIAALAGVEPGRATDGRSDLFDADSGWHPTLIQAGSADTRFWWRGTRTHRWTYVHWTDGHRQLFDRDNDPYQLRNLAGERPRVERRLARLTPNPY